MKRAGTLITAALMAPRALYCIAEKDGNVGYLSSVGKLNTEAESFFSFNNGSQHTRIWPFTTL